MPGKTRKSAAAERRIKLALYVLQRKPLSFAQIQEDLPEYAAAPCDPAKAQLASRRLFERDKEELSARGICIVASGHGGFAVHAQVFAGDEDRFLMEPGSVQAHAMRAACASLLQDPAYMRPNELRSAMAKLCDALEVPDSLQFAGETSLDALDGASAATRALQRKVELALSKYKLLKFSYPDSHGKQSQRCVEPMGLFTGNGCVYLAAWDTEKKAERCFRLDRMGKASVNGSGRGAPDFEPRDFDAQQWQVLPFQMGPASQEPVPALVDIDQNAMWQARNLCSKHGTVMLDSNGGASWYADCYDAVLLASWCIANGPGLVPRSPQSAREAYESLLAAAAGEETVHDAALVPSMPRKRKSATTRSSREAASAGEDALFSCLALLEKSGGVSIPQCALFLGVPEDDVYDALETLAFCYDAAGLRLELGERGCAFARLSNPAGLSMSLTAAEEAALADAETLLQESSVAQTLAQACGAEAGQALCIEYWKEGDAHPAPRIVFPKALLVRNGRTYLQAWCCKACDERLFRLDRIKSAVPTTQDNPLVAGRTGKEPSGKVPGTVARVTLAAGSRIPDWPGATIPKKPAVSGNVAVSVTWLGGPWLPKQIASLGPSVLAVEPDDLLDEVRAYARGLLCDIGGR